MSAACDIVDVADLDLVVAPYRWAFPERNGPAIAARWKTLSKEKPASYNGRMLLLARREFARRGDGALTLKGAYFETNYADYVAWRARGFPGDDVENCFSMAALQGADGAFLLGEMAPHTINGGQIYFPSGTTDLSDVFDGRVDLEASALRELLEETGLSADAAAVRDGWTVVVAQRRLACMKLMTLKAPADLAKAEIEAFLAREPSAELARVHVVRSPEDIDAARTPDFVAAYLRLAFAEPAAVAGK